MGWCQPTLNKSVEAVEAVENDLPNAIPQECSKVLDRTPVAQHSHWKYHTDPLVLFTQFAPNSQIVLPSPYRALH
jgi:hypothetical protein